jgi:predicted deacylase
MGWIRLIWLRIGTSEHGNEPPGSITCWEVLEQLHNWQFLKKGSAP